VKISEVQVLPLQITYPTVRSFGRHALTHGDNILVRVLTDDGLDGIGEAVSRPYIYGESQVSIVHAIQEWFAPCLVGRSPFDTASIEWDLAGVAGNPAAKAAIDMALVELQAKAAGLPTYRFLGGYQDHVDLSWILTYAPPGELADEASRRYSQGYRCFKVKVGPDVHADAERMEALKTVLGDDVRIYVDANATFERWTAVKRMDALDSSGVSFIEDPIAADDFDGRHWLASVSTLPMMADESATDLDHIDRELVSGGCQLFSIKIFRCGLSGGRAILARIAASNATAVIGGQGETTVGALIGSHFAAASRLTTKLPAELSGALRYDFDLLEGGIAFNEGRINLSDSPGYGITLDWDVVATLKVPVWSSGSGSLAAPSHVGWQSVQSVRQ
jgi:L-alanine-DL-glutamate epimerase-like enolase superfamily enzyme